MNSFPPARRRGYLTLGALAGLFILTSLLFGSLLMRSTLNVWLVLWLLLTVGSFALAAGTFYRLYALTRASYWLGRETLRLVWGLRVEEIPISDIEWVRPASDLTTPLRLPLFSVPGAILGSVQHPDLRQVEFLASDAAGLTLVATAWRVFAISPEDPAAFTRAFQRSVEMGSLTSLPSRSEYPAVLLSRAWQSRLNRAAWLLALFFNLGLLVWVTASLPGLKQVSLGFNPLRQPLDPAPAERLILLPVLSLFFSAATWSLGLFFYRRSEQAPLARALWVSAAVSALLFLVAVYFILSVV